VVDADAPAVSTAEDSDGAVSVRKLGKTFGEVVAVDDVSFHVRRGEMFAFLGPNGAGKSTTISILCTLLRPTSGTASVAGFDVAQAPAAVRRHIGLVFQESTLDDYLTAEENLRFHADLYGVPKPVADERIHMLMEMVELWERRGDIVGTFSGGMRRRLEIARGLIHSPSVLFLDEPTIGLDPQTRKYIWDYLLELHSRERITIFLTTHYMEEAEVFDRIAIIDHGRIVTEGSPQALKEQIGEDRVELVTDHPARAAAELHDQFGLDSSIIDTTLRVRVKDAASFVPHMFADLDVPIHTISVTRPTLDDVFITYTGRTIREAEASGHDRLTASPRLRARMRSRR
jgi:ABC-2 type transport system ATP-binding protein